MPLEAVEKPTVPLSRKIALSALVIIWFTSFYFFLCPPAYAYFKDVVRPVPIGRFPFWNVPFGDEREVRERVSQAEFRREEKRRDFSQATFSIRVDMDLYWPALIGFMIVNAWTIFLLSAFKHDIPRGEGKFPEAQDDLANPDKKPEREITFGTHIDGVYRGRRFAYDQATKEVHLGELSEKTRAHRIEFISHCGVGLDVEDDAGWARFEKTGDWEK